MPTRLGQYLVSSMKGLELDLKSDGTLTAIGDDGSVQTFSPSAGAFVPLSTLFTNGPVGIFYDNPTLNGIVDPIWKGGFNPFAVANTRQFYWAAEGNYFDTIDTVCEGYIHYVSANGAVNPFRPIFISVACNTNTDKDAIVVINVGSSTRNAGGGGASFQVVSTAQQLLTLKDSGAFFPTASAAWAMKMGTAFVLALPTTPQASVWSHPWSAPFATAVTANRLFIVAINVAVPCLLTGLQIGNDSVVSGNVKISLYDVTGNTLLASSGSVVQTGTFANQCVPFTSTYFASPGTYWACVMLDNATGKLACANPLASSGFATPGSFVIPATIAPPTQTARGTNSPVVATY